MRHRVLPFHGEAALRARDSGYRQAARYWSADDIAKLVRLADAQATTRQISLELGRSQLAVRLKASRMGLSLTGHEVRRSVRRQAKRQGRVAEAELTRLRKRACIAITVDFDLGALTRAERAQLAERLRVMEMEEMEVVAPGTAAPPPPAIDPPVLRRRKRKLATPYDPSAATAERNRAAAARRRETRAALGWTRTQVPAEDPRQLLEAARLRLREGEREERMR